MTTSAMGITMYQPNDTVYRDLSSKFECDLYKDAKTEENDGELNIHMNLPKTLVFDISENTKKIAEEEIKKLVRDRILKPSYYWQSSDNERPFQDWVKDLVKEQLNKDREIIIEKAAHEFAVSMKKSKIMRDKFANLFDEEDDLK